MMFELDLGMQHDIAYFRQALPGSRLCLMLECFGVAAGPQNSGIATLESP